MSVSTSSARDQAESTVEELKALLREAELALSSAGEQATDEVHALRDRVRNALAGGRETVKNLAASARRQAVQADEMIHENPYAAVGIAAGVGLLAGYLISRSCANSR